MGTVAYIHIASGMGQPMTALPMARVLDGKGIEGDRYASGIGCYSNSPAPGRHVTLIEIEVIEEMAEVWGIPFTPHESRRNITTKDIRLNLLVGKKLHVGSVVLDVVRLCDPCLYLQQLLNRPVLQPLVKRAGIRCDVVAGGTIRVGDTLTVLP